MAVMAIYPSATNAARASLFSFEKTESNQLSHSGNLWRPTTLSMIIFKGHGVATLIAVSTSIAIRIMITDLRYGRASPIAQNIKFGKDGLSFSSSPGEVLYPWFSLPFTSGAIFG